MLTERDIIVRLRDGHFRFPPLRFSLVADQPDALLEAAWGERRCRFRVQCNAYCSPRMLRETVGRLSDIPNEPGTYPLIVTAWLPPAQLDELERRQVSGIDLNGNGVVIIPNELLIRRTGQPNAYPRTLPIRNVYQGGSSLVGRVFLLQPEYTSVNDVYRGVRDRSGPIALSTVSRVLKELEEDLMIGREGRLLQLLQPDALLERLRDHYKPPRITSRFIGKSPLSLDEIGRRFGRLAELGGARAVLTGAASVNRYATMAREPILSFYTESDPEITVRRMELGAEPTNRFPNVEVIQTPDDAVYFDRRIEPDGIFASPVQAWLELATGESRQQDVAEQVKTEIIKNIAALSSKATHD